jgi:predicted alpha/beta-hydrolase family hydrolase
VSQPLERLLDTPHGVARVTEHPPVAGSRGLAVLLHGAGTTTSTPLQLAVADGLAAAGVAAVRVDQPYTLGARRPPAPAAQLDTVMRCVLDTLVAPVVLIGRSSGSRVACRVAQAAGVRGVVALGFPLCPPGRAGVSRAAELAAAGVPVTVVQGSRDAFGSAVDVAALKLPGVDVHEVVGADHAFEVRKRDGRSAAELIEEVVAVVIPVVQGLLALS